MKARIKKVQRHAVIIAVLALFPLPAFAAGGIATDSSLGMPAVSFSPAVGGPEQVVIPQSAGLTAGHNLFQSFSDFNISKGQTVTFEELQQGFLNNVIARVTGKETSTINGTLRVTPGGHANFYLLNPNGVLFGDGARIDVPGDFHVTTASYLKFQDGAKYGTEPVSSKLSSSSPAALGFTASNHANNVLISLSGEASLHSKNDNTSIDVVGSEIRIENGASIETTQNGGDIRLVAFKDVGEISVLKGKEGYLPLPKFSPSEGRAGDIVLDGHGKASGLMKENNGTGHIGLWGSTLSLKDGGGIETDTNGSASRKGSGGVDVHAHNFSISAKGDVASGIFSSNSGSGKGEAINLSIDHDLTLLGNAHIDSENSSSGMGGEINIRSTNIDMSAEPNYSSRIASAASSESRGESGQITITNKNNINISGAAAIYTQTMGGSDSGNIKIDSRSLSLMGNDPVDPTSIQTSAKEGSTGSSGQIDLQIPGVLRLEGNATILSTTHGSGNSGALKIQSGSTTLIGNDPSNTASIQTSAQEGSTGSSGRIDLLSQGSLRLEGNANILSATDGSGNSGALKIQSGSITLIGNNPDKPASIETTARIGSSGNSGDVDVISRILNVKGNAKIFTETAKGTVGKSGNIHIRNQGTYVRESSYGQPLILTDSYGEGSSGSVVISGGGLLRLNGTTGIATISNAAGNSGDVRIVKDNVFLSGSFSDKEHSPIIRTIANAEGDSGDIRIMASRSLQLDQYSLIETTSKAGFGAAGNVKILAGNLLIRDTGIGERGFIDRGITSTSRGPGDGGDVDIRVANDVLITSRYRYVPSFEPNDKNTSQLGIMTRAYGSGNAGDVSIKAGGDILLKGVGRMPSISPYDYFANAPYYGVIQSATKDNATGDVGSVTIQSGGRLGIDSFYIRTENEPQSRSLAGNITLKSMDGIFMRHGLVRINSYGGSKLSPARPAQLLVDSNKDFMMFRSGVYANAYQEGQTAADIRIHSGGDVVVSSDPFHRGGISSIGDNDAKGGSVTLEAQNVFALIHSGFGSDSYVENSLEHTLPIGVNVDIAAGGIFLDDGKIYVYSGDDAVSLSKAHLNVFTYGLFPSSNNLNGHYFYTKEGLSTHLYPGPRTNEIGKFNKTETDYNFSLNGSLFGISGVLPALSKAEFREDSLNNACDTSKAGGLLQSGKGGYRSGLEWELLH